MPKFLIERRIPDAGKLGTDDLRGIAQKSNSVLTDMRRNDHNVQWLHSYVTDNAIHCVYVADGPEEILEHARCGGFPADNIMEISTVIEAVTAE